MSKFEQEVEEVQKSIDASVPSSESIDFSSLDEKTASELQYIQQMAESDPSILEDETYKSLIAEIQKESGKKTKGDESDDEEEEEEDDDLEDEKDEEEEEEEDDSNPFASKSKKKSKEIPIDFDVPDGMTDIMKKHFGVNDLPTFLNSAETWRKQAQEASNFQKENEDLKTDIQGLPYEIKAQIHAYINGEDHLAVVKNMTRLDFEVDFSKQNVESLVQHYLPEEYDELIQEFNKEQLTEEQLDKQIALLGKTTKKFFDRDKQAIKTQRDEFAKGIAEEQKAVKNSALVSVEAFSKAYPDFSKSEINKIRSTLVEGKLENLFFNADGTYTKEAAEYAAFAMYGKKILDDMGRRERKKGASDANMAIVDKSKKSISKSKGTSGGKTDMGAVSHLQGVFKNDPYA